MDIRSGWRALTQIQRNDPPKSPWGGSGGSGGDGDNGDGKGGPGKGSGPRNPWSFPPEGKRGGKPGPSGSLDELLKRARFGGGGGGGGPSLPAGMNGRNILLIGIALILVAWIGFTSVWTIGQRERGVVTFFGRFSDVIGPGVHFTLPAPFNQVTRVDVETPRTETVPGDTNGTNLMLTGDRNIVDLAYSIQWRPVNPQDFEFQIKDPKETVRAVAESAMRAVISDISFDQAIGGGRSVVQARVRALMQQILNDYNSGIEVQTVAINKAVSPDQVSDDFKAVQAAQQEAQANIANSRSYAQQVIAQAEGEAAQFNKLYEQYKLSPEVTKRRMYYETMERVLAKSDKIVIESPGVTPYLPLPELRKALPEPAPAPATGGQAK